MTKKVVTGYLVGNEYLYHHTDEERATSVANEKNTTCRLVWALIDQNWFYGTWQHLDHCKGDIFETEELVWEAYNKQ